MSALARYRPGADGPFGPDEVRHLFRRAGFGLPWDDCGALARKGLDAALEPLLATDEGRDAAWTSRTANEVATAADTGEMAASEPLKKLRALCLLRMAQTRAPLPEKLALFWHGHFATSVEKVQDLRLIWRQYRLFRETGAGKFRGLLQAVSRDPAMVIWLDNDSNERLRPNENYARELMELFSMGVGRYTESDVKEAARAFTGWHVRHLDFWLDEHEHDGGEKKVLGKSGRLDGSDVVDLCVDHPACAPFLARKLLRFYVHPEPDDAAVAEVASALREEELDVGRSLARLFASRLFFSPAVRGTLIPSPVEYCVATLRVVGATASWKELGETAATMGQALFAPPNVKGWDGQAAWINTRTLLERGRFAEAVAFGGGALDVRADWKRAAGDAFAADGDALVQRMGDVLLGAPLGASSRAALCAFAASPVAGTGEARVRNVAHLLLCCAEANLH